MSWLTTCSFSRPCARSVRSEYRLSPEAFRLTSTSAVSPASRQGTGLIISHPPDCSDERGTNPLWPGPSRPWRRTEVPGASHTIVDGLVGAAVRGGRGPQWRIRAVFVTRGQAPEWTPIPEPPLAGGID